METERLILRRWAETDAEDLYRYAKDPEVGYPAGWKAHRNEEESRWIIRNVLNGPECYALCLKETGKPVGSIELKLNGSTDMTEKDDECELGYWLGKPYWGQGIMPEAVREILRYGFEDLGMKRIWAGYYDGNLKSKRVQEKCGFSFQWTTEGLELPQLGEIRTGHVMCLKKEEWEAMQ